jgi:hypothetical protein
MSNLGFLEEKIRELSPLEARFGSIRRRFKDPLERKKSRVAKALPIPVRVREFPMIYNSDYEGALAN